MRVSNLIRLVTLSCLFFQSTMALSKESSAFDCHKCNYVDLKAGAVLPTNLQGNSNLETGDKTYTYGIAVGRKLMDQLSAELEYMHRNKNTSSSNSGKIYNTWSAKSDAVMLNLKIDLLKDYKAKKHVKVSDLLKDSKVRPYIKVGAGISKNAASNYVQVDSSDLSTTTTNTYNGQTSNKFAWQIGAGVSIDTGSMFLTQIQYMFVNHGKISTSSNFTSATVTNGVVEPIKSNTGPAPFTGSLKDHVITLGVGIKF